MEAWQITAEFAIKWSTTTSCCLPAWSKHLLLQSQTRVIKCHLITLLDWHSSAIHLQHLKTVNETARKADVATHTQTHTQSVAYVCVCVLISTATVATAVRTGISTKKLVCQAANKAAKGEPLNHSELHRQTAKARVPLHHLAPPLLLAAEKSKFVAKYQHSCQRNLNEKMITSIRIGLNGFLSGSLKLVRNPVQIDHLCVFANSIGIILQYI